ncbi:MAG TPA: type 4a pilus biogenesis protein PilO [Candidatus Sulfotelmatobacter sp.]|jgi:type IV pilus assembly protein PilO|nr:type 4a pilus biogenesis protein PilO [Candidatus Sulfotelmatobacter sp.]
MPDLRRTRRDLKTALAIMIGIDLVAAIVYFSPLVGSAESRRTQMNQLQTELNTKTRQVAPLKDLPKKVDIAGKQITDFYKKRFPATNSEILTELGKLTHENGVMIESGKYKLPDEEVGHVQPVEMEYDLSGNYTALAKFINAVERDEMFFVINSIELGGQPHGAVKLKVKLETYLKAAS